MVEEGVVVAAAAVVAESDILRQPIFVCYKVAAEVEVEVMTTMVAAVTGTRTAETTPIQTTMKGNRISTITSLASK